MNSLSVQPFAAISVMSALKSARSVPELIARWRTLSFPASISHAFTVTVRRGSMMIDPRRRVRFIRELLLLLVHRGPSQVGDPMI